MKTAEEILLGLLPVDPKHRKAILEGPGVRSYAGRSEFFKGPLVPTAGMTHAEKMKAKKDRDRALYERAAGPGYTRANLSQRHPDSGLTPKEHEAAKRRRALS